VGSQLVLLKGYLELEAVLKGSSAVRCDWHELHEAILDGPFPKEH